MKDAVKKYWAVALMFLTVTAVCLLFSCRKSGMFIDEIYTYGLSNRSYAPYITDIKGGSALGQVITREELFDYVAVTEGEGFDFGSCLKLVAHQLLEIQYYRREAESQQYGYGKYHLLAHAYGFAECVGVVYYLSLGYGVGKEHSSLFAALKQE